MQSVTPHGWSPTVSGVPGGFPGMDARIPFQPLPIDQSHVVYDHGPDSLPQPGVTAGRTTRLQLTDSRAFPGTSRDIHVHAPSESDSAH